MANDGPEYSQNADRPRAAGPGQRGNELGLVAPCLCARDLVDLDCVRRWVREARDHALHGTCVHARVSGVYAIVNARVRAAMLMRVAL
jgi:hypothetical protein